MAELVFFKKFFHRCSLILLSSALVMEASFLTLHCYAETAVPVVPFIVHFLAAFVAYTSALLCLFRRSLPPGALLLPLILGSALLFRITLLLVPPIWDDDLYRYLWDGRVGIHGINPYLYPPDAPQLEVLQDDNYDLVSFKNIPTVYPPLFQFLFQWSQWVAPSSPFFLKCLALFFDLALIAVLLSTLKKLGYPLTWILIYAWNPLPIKEFSNSGHMDSLVLFLLFLSLRWILDQRMVLAHLGLSLSVLAKLFTVTTLPFLLACAYRKSRRTFLICLGAFSLILLLGYAPFVQADARLFEGLAAYSRYWNFNAGPFRLIERGLQILGWNQPWLARGLVLAAMIGVMTWQLMRLDNSFASLFKAVFYSLAALVLLSPAVQPWYLCWLIPFYIFFPKPSWITLSGLAVLSYLFYLNFAELSWPRVVEFGIPAAIALWELFRNKTKQKGHTVDENLKEECL